MNRYRKQYPNSGLSGAEAVTKYIRMKRKMTNRLVQREDDEVILDHHHTWVAWDELLEFRPKIIFICSFHSKRDISWYKALIDEFTYCPPSPLP